LNEVKSGVIDAVGVVGLTLPLKVEREKRCGVKRENLSPRAGRRGRAASFEGRRGFVEDAP
jgi:hypothetical protein